MIIQLSKKTINTEDGEKTIFTGIISDESGARSFTACFDLNIGDVVHITGVYVRSWQHCPMINLGGRSKLNMSIVSHETGIKKLSELRDGDMNVHICFVILNIQSQKISTKDGDKEILNGIIADENTKLPMTSWVVLPELVEGDVIEVKNTYVRLFHGVPTLNINENSKVEKIDKIIHYKQPERILIGELIKRDGAFDVTIEGLSVRPGSGLIARCPECYRVIQKGVCRVHGKVKEEIDMRIKAIIDDGTGALMLVLDAELTQQVCDLSIEEAKKIAKDAVSFKAVEEEIKKKLIGKVLKARGNMSKAEFGVIFVANKVWQPSGITNKASKLLGIMADQYGKNN